MNLWLTPSSLTHSPLAPCDQLSPHTAHELGSGITMSFDMFSSFRTSQQFRINQFNPT